MDLIADLKLAATPLHASLGSAWDAEPIVLQLTRNPNEPVRHNRALLVDSATAGKVPTGYGGCFRVHADASEPEGALGSDMVRPFPQELAYLEAGDIIRLNPRRGEAWVMYRRSSKHNSMLLTERCNSWCVMCSQPPKAKEDDSLIRAWLEAIPLMNSGTAELGITGGEPTLLKDRFFDLIASCKENLPSTGLHVLSNGRMFNYLSFAQKLEEIAHSGLMIGIPLYSDVAWQHDFIVQAPKAFDQTIRGILNLARCQIRVEVRVVIHSYSIDRLPNLAEFLCRNLPFVEHVALMGLEPIGFAKTNFSALWTDPADYQETLRAAVRVLTNHGMNLSIYNHQLCVLPEELWPFARQSISDWKNVFLPECRDCGVRDSCGGFFHSATARHSKGIRPIQARAVAAN